MEWAVLNPRTGEFRYASAGHPGPLHIPYQGDPIILESDGFPIGLADGVYEEWSVWLKAGDRLYLYSDGVTEAMNSAGDQFGEARLREAIGKARSESLPETIANLQREINSWHGAEQPHDDISILAIEIPAASGPE